MPLDGHAHLVAQGWSGKGAGLRHGAITKPVTVVQKKTLAGIGKDRDEAFPFWDHVFQAASVSIQVKVHNSDDEEGESDSDESSTPAVELKRTCTGILSTRRPATGTPALSGTTTPSDGSGIGSVTPQLSLMAAAKQQAARRMLYSMFYRGPVLATEDVEKAPSNNLESAGQPSSSSSSQSLTDTEEGQIKKVKKRKADGDDSDKQEKKRRKCEAKLKERRKRKEKEKEAKGRESDVNSEDEGHEGSGVDELSRGTEKGTRAMRKAEKAAMKAEKAERKRRKEERRAEERRKLKAERQAQKGVAISKDAVYPELSPALHGRLEERVKEAELKSAFTHSGEERTKGAETKRKRKKS